MKLRFAGVERCGRAVDLRRVDVTAEVVLGAVRDQDDERVTCRPPTPVHRHVGLLAENASVPDAETLAAVAVSYGLSVDAGVPPRDPADLRRALADATEDVTRLRERVERASGRLAARRELDVDTEDAAAALRAATRELTDAETERVAARQRLDAAEARLRAARTERELELVRADARRNHPEIERRALVERVRPLLARARAAVPDWNPELLAAARIARNRAPVVVADGPFRHPVQAAACLAGPVILV